MKHTQFQHLTSRLEFLTDNVNINAFLYDMGDYYDNTPSESVFYSKDEYLVRCSDEWLEEKLAIESKLKHLQG